MDRWEETKGGGGGYSGCGFGGEQYSTSWYHSRQNQSLNWRASPSPRINWGVLMDSEWINWWLSYFGVLTQCAQTTQHTHLHGHHCGAMQMFTPRRSIPLLKKKEECTSCNRPGFIKQLLASLIRRWRAQNSSLERQWSVAQELALDHKCITFSFRHVEGAGR